MQTCIVTGGSSGIGLSIVKRFLNDGYKVFNLDIKPSGIGTFIDCDVSSVNQVQQCIAGIVKSVNHIDILIANAGIYFSATIEATTEKELDNLIAINIKGTYAAICAVLPAMKAQQKGAIILMGSDQSIIGKRCSFAYGLSKAAIASMARTTALDYADYGIRVNAVCPGTIDTPLYHKAMDLYCRQNNLDKTTAHAEEAALQPLGRLGTPGEVASLVSFLASDEAGFITGSLQVIDGGYTCQ